MKTTAARDTREIRALTGVRGVAACLVVLYHFFQDSPGLGPAYHIIKHGYSAVDLFFVLSGFVMALTYGNAFRRGFTSGDYLSFLGKRLGRIYPLYFVVTAGVGLLVHAHAIHGDPASPGTLLANFALVQAWGLAPSIGGPTWSISTEFAAYLAFPALVALVLTSRTYVYVLAAGAAVTTIIVLAHLPATTLNQVSNGVADRSGPLDIFGTGTVYPLLRCLAGFSLGLVAYRLYHDRSVSAVLAWRRSGDVAALAVVALLFMSGSDVALEIAFVFLVITLTSGRSWTAAAMGSAAVFWLGEVSYSIYLVHRPIESLTRHPLVALLESHHVPHAYTVAGFPPLVLTLIVSALTFYGIEKPARTWSRRLMGQGAPAISLEPGAP